MKTPAGKDCIAFSTEGRMYELVVAQARGSWQRAVVQNLVKNGYVVGYRADGMLKGRARSYSSKYAKSLANLMYRIDRTLAENTPYSLCYGPTGEKKGFGYWIGSV